MKTLKIFTYKCDNGELISENLYSDFLFVFNNTVSHNYLYENNKYNIIIGTDYPPENLIFNNGEWKTDKNKNILSYNNLIKLFG